MDKILKYREQNKDVLECDGYKYHYSNPLKLNKGKIWKCITPRCSASIKSETDKNGKIKYTPRLQHNHPQHKSCEKIQSGTTKSKTLFSSTPSSPNVSNNTHQPPRGSITRVLSVDEGNDSHVSFYSPTLSLSFGRGEQSKAPSSGPADNSDTELLENVSPPKLPPLFENPPQPKKADKSASSSVSAIEISTADKKEIELLRKLNTELVHRLKAIEDELKATKEKVNQLMMSSQTPPSSTSQDLHHPKPSTSSAFIIPSPMNVITSEPIIDPSNPVSPRLLVCGDSMTRGFGDILQQLLPQYLIQCLTYPGATLSAVLKSIPTCAADFNKRDIVLIMAGSNDIPNLSPHTFDNELTRLTNICKSTNVIFSSVPYKFHAPKHNTNIFASNQHILKQSSVFKYLYFECNFYLSRRMYTRHGLHFNALGKQTFCEKFSYVLSFINLSTHSFLLPTLKDPKPNSTNCHYNSVQTCLNDSQTDDTQSEFAESSANSSTFFLENL
ncbi:hypothetical protein M8J76_012781 [Diaphorina citri]|nr:hypothetical protein M8J75_006509 [Diaphorina citri]KAI5730360.1 hypothetical protein M8J76_012781 [Diaphorina citri]